MTYRYPGADRPALQTIDLVIPAGRSLAVVGRSGAGKTTLINVLLRAVDPTAGRITADGSDLRDLDVQAYQRLFAVVSQDVYLFHGTIAENLRLADPGATNGRLQSAARDASILDFIESLPRGFATIVGERGVRLSGGERQRLAIARAFLKDAPVLVLDEPTSSLDGGNERTVRESLERLTAGRTTLVISHRLSAVDFADRVVMLEDGSIIEEGAPQELMERRGRFADLVRAQAVTA